MLKPSFTLYNTAKSCRSDRLRHALGFTLIEVLISMIILAIGLLGLASLQALALKNNKDAFLFTQASLLAYEMGDRIKADKAYWGPQFDVTGTPIAYNLVPDPTSETNGCSDPNQACLDHEIAGYDYAYWINSVQNTLPTPASGVPAAQILMSAAVLIPPCTTVNAFPAQPAICLVLTWQRSDQSNAAGLGIDNTYRLEITP
jgi:type IV pilus assembly protein PilV